MLLSHVSTLYLTPDACADEKGLWRPDAVKLKELLATASERPVYAPPIPRWGGVPAHVAASTRMGLLSWAPTPTPTMYHNALRHVYYARDDRVANECLAVVNAEARRLLGESLRSVQDWMFAGEPDSAALVTLDERYAAGDAIPGELQFVLRDAEYPPCASSAHERLLGVLWLSAAAVDMRKAWPMARTRLLGEETKDIDGASSGDGESLAAWPGATAFLRHATFLLRALGPAYAAWGLQDALRPRTSAMALNEVWTAATILVHALCGVPSDLRWHAQQAGTLPRQTSPLLLQPGCSPSGSAVLSTALAAVRAVLPAFALQAILQACGPASSADAVAAALALEDFPADIIHAARTEALGGDACAAGLGSTAPVSFLAALLPTWLGPPAGDAAHPPASPLLAREAARSLISALVAGLSELQSVVLATAVRVTDGLARAGSPHAHLREALGSRTEAFTHSARSSLLGWLRREHAVACDEVVQLSLPWQVASSADLRVTGVGALLGIVRAHYAGTAPRLSSTRALSAARSAAQAAMALASTVLSAWMRSVPTAPAHPTHESVADTARQVVEACCIWPSLLAPPHETGAVAAAAAAAASTAGALVAPPPRVALPPGAALLRRLPRHWRPESRAVIDAAMRASSGPPGTAPAVPARPREGPPLLVLDPEADSLTAMRALLAALASVAREDAAAQTSATRLPAAAATAPVMEWLRSPPPGSQCATWPPDMPPVVALVPPCADSALQRNLSVGVLCAAWMAHFRAALLALASPAGLLRPQSTGAPANVCTSCRGRIDESVAPAVKQVLAESGRAPPVVAHGRAVSASAQSEPAAADPSGGCCLCCGEALPPSLAVPFPPWSATAPPAAAPQLPSKAAASSSPSRSPSRSSSPASFAAHSPPRRGRARRQGGGGAATVSGRGGRGRGRGGRGGLRGGAAARSTAAAEEEGPSSPVHPPSRKRLRMLEGGGALRDSSPSESDDADPPSLPASRALRLRVALPSKPYHVRLRVGGDLGRPIPAVPLIAPVEEWLPELQGCVEPAPLPAPPLIAAAPGSSSGAGQAVPQVRLKVKPPSLPTAPSAPPPQVDIPSARVAEAVAPTRPLVKPPPVIVLAPAPPPVPAPAPSSVPAPVPVSELSHAPLTSGSVGKVDAGALPGVGPPLDTPAGVRRALSVFDRHLDNFRSVRKGLSPPKVPQLPAPAQPSVSAPAKKPHVPEPVVRPSAIPPRNDVPPKEARPAPPAAVVPRAPPAAAPLNPEPLEQEVVCRIRVAGQPACFLVTREALSSDNKYIMCVQCENVIAAWCRDRRCRWVFGARPVDAETWVDADCLWCARAHTDAEWKAEALRVKGAPIPAAVLALEAARTAPRPPAVAAPRAASAAGSAVSAPVHASAVHQRGGAAVQQRGGAAAASESQALGAPAAPGLQPRAAASAAAPPIIVVSDSDSDDDAIPVITDEEMLRAAAHNSLLVSSQQSGGSSSSPAGAASMSRMVELQRTLLAGFQRPPASAASAARLGKVDLCDSDGQSQSPLPSSHQQQQQQQGGAAGRAEAPSATSYPASRGASAAVAVAPRAAAAPAAAAAAAAPRAGVAAGLPARQALGSGAMASAPQVPPPQLQVAQPPRVLPAQQPLPSAGAAPPRTMFGLQFPRP